MKNCIRLVIGAVLICSTLITSDVKAQQVPQTLTYQSVLRNSNNVLMANTAVGIKISILQGNAQGLEIFSETQSVTTNANGLLSLQIGAGNAVTGAFSNIDWANGPYFIKTETDPTGGNNYSIVGTQQLASVPYALYAAKSGDATIMGAISNSPSANGGIITNGALSLTPADASSGGVVTTGDQTFAGNKTFVSDIKVNGITVGRGGGNVDENIAIGIAALPFNSTGYGNIAAGYIALFSNSTGNNNIAMGTNSLLNNNDGSDNIAIGTNTLRASNANSNTALGVGSLFSNTSGTQNVASGTAALSNNTIGNYNTANGVQALYFNVSGSNNTALGNHADVATGNLSNATAIGAGAIVDSSNKIQLGNADVASVNTSGIYKGAGFVKAGGTSAEYLMADGTTSVGPDLSGLATTTDLNNLQNQVNVQSTINQVQQSQITDLNTVNQTQDQNISTLNSQMNDQNTINQAQQNQINDLNAVNQIQQNQINDLNTVNQTQDQNISTLNSQVQTNTTDNFVQQNQINDLTSVNQIQDQNISALNSQVQTNTTDNIVQQNQIDNMNTQNAVQDQSIMNLGTQVQMNTADNINQQNQIDNMNTQNAMQDLSIMNLGSQVQMNTADNINQQNQIDNMNTQNAMQDQSIMNLGSQVQTNTTDIINLQSQISNVQSNFVTTVDDPSAIHNVNSGNVGIGTDLPGEKLDVAGNLKVRENMILNGKLNNMNIGNLGSGTTNVTLGDNAFNTNASGDGNTSIGYSAMQNSTTGWNNVAVGAVALNANTTGFWNNAIGWGSLMGNTTGFQNIGLGNNTLTTNTTGSQNTAIGNQADVAASDLNNATAIGHLAIVDASNKIQLGNTDVTSVNTSGIYTGAGFKTPNGTSSQFLMADGSVSTGGTGGASVFVATTSNPDNISNVNAGNVGIGTDLPSEKLDVNGNLKVRQNATITGTLNIEPAPWGQTSTSFPSPAQINLSGRMGIGTNNPSALLNIVGGDRENSLRIESSNAGVALVSTREYQIFTRQQGDLAFYDQTAEQETNGGYPYRMIINSTGKVGIGNQSPTEQLDVTGNIKSNQNVMANSFVKAGGQANEFLMADGTTSYGPSLSGLVTMADLSGYATTQALNSVESNLASALNNETTRAIAAEYNLQTSLDDETSRATTQEYILTTSLNAETTRAVAAEQALASATKRGTVGYFGSVSIGTGFTSSLLTIGYYSIIFDTPLTNTPIVVATLVDAIGFCAISNVSTTGFTVIVKSPNGTAMSSSFSFIVMAP